MLFLLSLNCCHILFKTFKCSLTEGFKFPSYVNDISYYKDGKIYAMKDKLNNFKKFNEVKMKYMSLFDILPEIYKNLFNKLKTMPVLSTEEVIVMTGEFTCENFTINFNNSFNSQDFVNKEREMKNIFNAKNITCQELFQNFKKVKEYNDIIVKFEWNNFLVKVKNFIRSVSEAMKGTNQFNITENQIIDFLELMEMDYQYIENWKYFEFYAQKMRNNMEELLIEWRKCRKSEEVYLLVKSME